jgi:hypothetical protein
MTGVDENKNHDEMKRGEWKSFMTKNIRKN